MINDDNPFGHILYEMEMYLSAYNEEYLRGQKLDLNNQFAINLLIDSRAIHLRSLAQLFKQEKRRQYWHVSDFINNTSNVSLIDDTLYDRIQDYTSCGTAHLLVNRLDEKYKEESKQCYNEAYPQILTAISSFISALEHDIKNQDYKAKFEVYKVRACEIKKRVDNILGELPIQGNTITLPTNFISYPQYSAYTPVSALNSQSSAFPQCSTLSS